MIRSILKCEICKMGKEGVKSHRTKFGHMKVYFACEKCEEEMKTTAKILTLCHKKAVGLGKFQSNSGLRTISSFE